MFRLFVLLLVFSSVNAREEVDTPAVKLGCSFLGLACLASSIAASLFTSITLTKRKDAELEDVNREDAGGDSMLIDETEICTAVEIVR
ncbi:hypothetical protein M3Y94_01028400 [Aphelenchoides besseyi]|nr:hypothetical protein M3Y94_01028400 [Aphelenchoides besseyi]